MFVSNYLLLNIFCSDECAWLSLSVPHHPKRSVGPNEGRKDRLMTGLTALQVRNAKPGRPADGRGLYLLVRPSGSDRKSGVEGKSVSVRVDLGGGPIIKKNTKKH